MTFAVASYETATENKQLWSTDSGQDMNTVPTIVDRCVS